MTPHQKSISDEEFAALLARSGTDLTDVAAGDPAIGEIRQALQSYRAETLHWAERRSAGQPSLSASVRRAERWAALPRWSLALVALVTIAGGVAHVAGNRDAMDQPPAVPDASASAAVTASGAVDIEADNQLLSSIDAALSYHAASPVDSLDLQKKQAEPASVRPGVTD